MRLKRTEHIPPSTWQSERLVIEDHYGNRGEVIFPRKRERGYGMGSVRWEDAEVSMYTSVEGSADETAAAAEFALELAHMAKTLDLALADDAKGAKEEQANAERDREIQNKARQVAIKQRCEELSQYYMQLVRVKRTGHRANAKGELHVEMRERDGETVIRPAMWLKESNGNLWSFEAYAVDTFEVKNGQRYEEVNLTSMETLESLAKKELELETA